MNERSSLSFPFVPGVKITPFFFVVAAGYILAAVFMIVMFSERALVPILLIAFIPAALIAFARYFEYSFFFYLAVLPLAQHYLFYSATIGSFQITPHMLMQFIFSLGTLGWFFLSFNGSRPKHKLNGSDIIIILFALSSVTGLMMSYSFPVNHEKSWMIFYCGIIENVSFFFLLLFVLNTVKDGPRILVRAIMLSTFASLIVAFSELRALDFDIFTMFLSRQKYGFGYHNTNLYGIHAAVIFPILFYAVNSEKKGMWKTLSKISLISLTVLSILCFNRGTFMTLAIQLLMLYFIRQNRKKVYLYFFAALVIGFFFQDFIKLYLERFFVGSSTEEKIVDQSSFYRFEAWRIGFQSIFLYPFGAGPGTFIHLWEMYSVNPRIGLPTPHQLFLHIASDFGAFTMLLFIAFLGFLFRMLSRITEAFNTHPLAGIGKYLKISIVGFVLYGIVTDGELAHLSGDMLPNNGYTLYFFALAALVSHIYAKCLSEKNLSSVSEGPDGTP